MLASRSLASRSHAAILAWIGSGHKTLSSSLPDSTLRFEGVTQLLAGWRSGSAVRRHHGPSLAITDTPGPCPSRRNAAARRGRGFQRRVELDSSRVDARGPAPAQHRRGTRQGGAVRGRPRGGCKGGVWGGGGERRRGSGAPWRARAGAPGRGSRPGGGGLPPRKMVSYPAPGIIVLPYMAILLGQY